MWRSSSSRRLGATFQAIGIPSRTSAVQIFLAETGGQHGVLPQQGLVDTLRNQTPVDLVGYGVRNYIRGGGPCGGQCKPVTGDVFTRYAGQANVFASNGVIGSEFLKLHANKVGVCHGDSGGPDLVAGTNIILAVNSFGGGRGELEHVLVSGRHAGSADVDRQRDPRRWRQPLSRTSVGVEHSLGPYRVTDLLG